MHFDKPFSGGPDRICTPDTPRVISAATTGQTYARRLPEAWGDTADIFVDVAMSRTSGAIAGPAEIRGVRLQASQPDAAGRLGQFVVCFHEHVDVGSNNLGEYLAIVRAFQFARAHGLVFGHVFTDNLAALRWIQRGIPANSEYGKDGGKSNWHATIAAAEQWARQHLTPSLIQTVTYWNKGDATSPCSGFVNPADFARR